MACEGNMCHCKEERKKEEVACVEMLNEGRIFELCFNYSYSNSNAGNSTSVCKGAKGVNNSR